MVWSYRWLYKLLDAGMLVYFLGVSCVLRLMFSVLMYVFGNNGDNNFVQIFDTRATWSVNFMYWYLRLVLSPILVICKEEYYRIHVSSAMKCIGQMFVSITLYKTLHSAQCGWPSHVSRDEWRLRPFVIFSVECVWIALKITCARASAVVTLAKFSI